MGWGYLLVAILFEIVGTSALKASDGFSKALPATISVVSIASAFFFLSLTLKTIPVGIAYAIWSGIGIVLISTIGFVFFQQRLDGPALVGIGLIVAGVVVINTLSKSVAH